jgi:hypothetical protein
VLAVDSWTETAPLPPVDDDYQGRRRRGLRRIGSRPSRAGWLVVLGVVISLSAAVAVPFLISGNSPDHTATGGRETTAPDSSISTDSTDGAGGLPIIMAPTATPTDTPLATTSAPSVTTPATSAPTTTPPLLPPGAPSNLATSGPTTTTINVSWTASTGTVSQYLIESCVGITCTNFTQFGTATATAVTLSGLSTLTTYSFRVRAKNSAGNSGYSDVVIGTTTLTIQAEDHGTPFQQSNYCSNVKGVLLGMGGSGSFLTLGTFAAPNAATYRITVYDGTQNGQDTVRLSVDGTSQPTWTSSGCGQSQVFSLSLTQGSHSLAVAHKGSLSQNVLIDRVEIIRP